MINQTLNHVRGNAIAYVALFFAIGGGGGAAIAATVTASSSTVHACVSKKNGAVYIAKKCTKAERVVNWSKVGPRGATGAAGAAAVQAFGSVGTFNAGVEVSNGLSFQSVTAGQWAVTVTASACRDLPQVATVTAQGTVGIAGTPIAYGSGSNDSPILVTTGVLNGGSFTQSDQTGFTIQVECGRSSS